MRVEVESEVQGSVWKVEVVPGASVSEGDVLMILESMKMESGVASPCDGQVDEVRVKIGQALESGDVLITFKTSKNPGHISVQ